MSKDEPIKASDARQQWKELLDRAANGEVIKIIRSGVVFYLGTSSGMDAGMGRVVDSAMKLGEHIATHKNVQKRTEIAAGQEAVRTDEAAATVMGLCKHGKPSGRCMSFACPNNPNTR